MPKTINKNINKEYFLVCVDESREFLYALDYACANASEQKVNLILLYIMEVANFRHWKGVETIMLEEQKAKAKDLLDSHASKIKLNYKFKVKTIIKRGDRVETILKIINNNRYKIKNLILGLAMEGNDTNKIINSLTGSFRKKLNLPITIVPDNYNNHVFKNRRNS
ncbi:MAG: universal stress protein [Pseudomonadota bacterium]|nr:universal stress protein [Pseudomonadota bacterium]